MTTPPAPDRTPPRRRVRLPRAAHEPRVGPSRLAGLRGRLSRAGKAVSVRSAAAASTVGRWCLGLVRLFLALPGVRLVTPLGWTLLAAFVVLGVSGWLFAWLEFRGLALMVGVLALLAIPFVLGRDDHAATLRLQRSRVKVGEQGLGEVIVRSRSGQSVGAQQVELPVGRRVTAFRVGSLRDEDEHEEVFTIPTRRRGVIPVGPVRAVREDPVGLLRRSSDLTQRQELFVHPRTVAVAPGAIGLLRDVEGITTQNLSSSDVSFHALREYVPGDDRRAVHWRSTARTGRLMVRQFEETLRAHLLLVLSTRREDYANEPEFELAVSTAASIGAGALRGSRRVTLCSTEGHVPFPSGMGLLDELCRIEARRSDVTIPQAAATATRAASGASVAALVCGSVVQPADLRAAHLKFPADVACFAVRVGESLSLARRRIGRLTILDIQDLDQLNGALRSLS